MAEISFPLEAMRESARQIVRETQQLAGEVGQAWQCIQGDVNALGTLKPGLGQLNALHQQLQDVLAFRQQLGERLAAAADDAQSVDAWIAQRF
jgi:hypothetical protein